MYLRCNMSCFGAVDGLVGCNRCTGPHTGSTGSLNDGCVDAAEKWALGGFVVVAAVILWSVRNRSWQALTLAAAGMVLMESSAYHVLFGEGARGAQPSPKLEAINSRAVTVTVLTSAIAVTVTCVAAGVCASYLVRKLHWLYGAAAAAMAGISSYDSVVRLGYPDLDTVYGAFDVAGVVLGAITIAAATSDVYPDSGDAKSQQ